jgi:branched-chain amino acid transport system permease protein
VGSALLVWGGAELGQGLDYWRGVLGLVIMLVMVLAPSGVLGAVQQWLARRKATSHSSPTPSKGAA